MTPEEFFKSAKSIPFGGAVELGKDHDWTMFQKCCDCGLIHKLVFEITNNNTIKITSYRIDNISEVSNYKIVQSLCKIQEDT